jgi:3'-5' exoribonuclease
VHLVLAHHGKLEYGSPKVPLTLEALVTHFIDDLDSRMNSWVNLMGRDGGSRRWTDASNIYGHHIWRGALPTAQVEKKGPPPELLTPVIYVPREAPQGGGEPRRGGAKGKPKPAARPPRAEPRPAEAGATATAAAAEGAAPAPRPESAAHAERPPRPERPERPERPDRGPRGPGGPGARGPGGPGDRKPRYMGPRQPGDRGPPPRSEKPKSLTHNPFAALAAKVEGAAAAAPPPEPAAATPDPIAAAEPPPEAAPAAVPVPEPADATAPPAPAGGGESAS